MRLHALVLTLMLLVPGLAFADAMPACGPNEHLETNPTSPGAMHHAGGQCVSNCSVAAGARSGSTFGLAVFGVALALVHSRRRVSSSKSR